MARIVGAIAGVATGLSAVYLIDEQFRSNSKKIGSELKRANDIALNKPHLVRPYTDPINLQTRSIGDSFVDIWNSNLIAAIDWMYGLGEAKKTKN